MHTRSEWLTMYSDLSRTYGDKRKFMYVIWKVLIMLVEDKIKEMQK